MKQRSAYTANHALRRCEVGIILLVCSAVARGGAGGPVPPPPSFFFPQKVKTDLYVQNAENKILSPERFKTITFVLLSTRNGTNYEL